MVIDLFRPDGVPPSLGRTIGPTAEGLLLPPEFLTKSCLIGMTWGLWSAWLIVRNAAAKGGIDLG